MNEYLNGILGDLTRIVERVRPEVAMPDVVQEFLKRNMPLVKAMRNELDTLIKVQCTPTIELFTINPLEALNMIASSKVQPTIYPNDYYQLNSLNNPIVWHDMWHSDHEGKETEGIETEEILGFKFKPVSKTGGYEGAGEYMDVVLRVQEVSTGREVYLKWIGSYDSYGGDDWDYRNIQVVQPKEKVVTVYERIDAR